MAQTEGAMKIVILGGNYAGVTTAHYLLKHVVPKLPKSKYEVVMISTSSHCFSRPSFPRAMIADDLLPMDKVFRSIPALFEKYPSGSFTFVQGRVSRLDHKDRKVVYTLDGGATETLPFHALVIATGASTASPLLSMNRDEEHLKDSWARFRAALPQAKSIVIAGGGPASVEAAGELGEHLNGRAGWFSGKLENPKVPITVVTAASKILPVLRPAIAATAEQELAKVGVTVMKTSRVTAVQPAGAGTGDKLTEHAAITLEDGRTLEADLYVPATGVMPNTDFVADELLTADHRVQVDGGTLRADKAGPRIYAIGDVASYSRPAVHLIFDALPVLCANVRRDLRLAEGEDEGAVGPDRVFEENKKEMQLVPIGRARGVGSAMGFRMPSFLVWLLKGRDYMLWTGGMVWTGNMWNKEK